MNVERDDLVQGDPDDRDLVDLLLEAASELIALNRPSTTADRAAICQRRNIPGWVFGYLGRKGFLTKRDADIRDVAGVLAASEGDPDQLRAILSEIVGTHGGQRRQPTSYVRAIERELQICAAADGFDVQEAPRAHILASRTDWTTLLWPALQKNAESWIGRKDRHLWLHHLRSSQCFAVNLFGPLHLALPWANDVWHNAFPAVSAVEFEYPLDGDPLKEETAKSKSRTRADVRLDAPGRSWIVEVKFTEPEFGACSAGHDPETPNRQLSCDAAFMSIEHLRDNCYLHGIGRTYFPLLSSPDSPIDLSKLALHGIRGCPLRNDLYQIVRNLLLVQILRREGRDARFAVVAPSAELNPSLHAARGPADSLVHFIRSILTDGSDHLVTVVEVEGVIERAEKHHTSEGRDWATFMKRRYLGPLRAGRRAMRG